MAMPGFVALVMWPVAKKAAGQLIQLVASNDELQKKFSGLMGQLAAIKKARTPEARISRAMATVREQGQHILDHPAGQSDALTSQRAANWIQRADQIERALRIVENQPRATRKAQLPKVESMADTLLGEMLTVLMDDAAPHSPVIEDGSAL